jgi:hypothetical protein
LKQQAAADIREQIITWTATEQRLRDVPDISLLTEQSLASPFHPIGMMRP